MMRLVGPAGFVLFLGGWFWFGWLVGGGRGVQVVTALVVVVIGMILMATGVGSRFVITPDPRER